MKVPKQRKFRGGVIINTNVSRVDCKKAKGWQVRWPGHSKFFSDRRYGSEIKSLYAANTYRDENFPGRKGQADPDKGVVVQVWVPEGRKTAVMEVVAYHPQRGRSPRRWYVGTKNTATKEKLDSLVGAAHTWRRSVIAEHNHQNNLV